MSRPVAFPTWRGTWASLEGIEPLLSKADTFLARRSKGNQRLPRWNSDQASSDFPRIMGALRRWVGGEPPADLSARPVVASRIHVTIFPALSALRWPRWLYLERAFLDGSATGDLHFAAIALRALCEELKWQNALDLSEEALKSLAVSPNDDDQERLLLFLRVVLCSLDDLPQNIVLEGVGWPSLELFATKLPRLHGAQQALNDYVHPNYGSHIVALYPERAAAARVLLESMIDIYDEFFRLSWAEVPLKGPSKPLGIGAVQRWPRTVEHFLKRSLPELRKIPELNMALGQNSVSCWLSVNQNDAAAMLNSPELTGLIPTHNQDVFSKRDILTLVCARLSEQRLIEEFPDGAPEPSAQVRWLRFVSGSLELAVSLDLVKGAAFKVQLVRQIVAGNDLGIDLCIRSLVEHRACTEWLVKRLGGAWEALGKRVKPDLPLPNESAVLDKTLADFLSGTKATVEEAFPWVMREIGGRRTGSLNLRTAVEQAFPEDDRFRQFYSVSSAAIHGRLLRGIEIAASDNYRNSAAVALGVLVLERLTNPDETMDVVAPAFVLAHSIDHAASVGGSTSVRGEVQAKQAFGQFGGKLKLGRDYTGEGTREAPFRFRRHLSFHSTSYELLAQLGVTNPVRKLDRSMNGLLCDCYSADDREWWFEITGQPGSAS